MGLVVPGSGGTITVSESVLSQIVRRAAETVDGAKVKRRRTVDVEARTVRLALTVRTGVPLQPLAERVQEAVAEALRSMCALDVRVDVAIEELE